MRPNKYAINLISMLFWLKYAELRDFIEPNIIRIYKIDETYVGKSLDITSYIIYGIIYRNDSVEKREYNETLYRLHIQNIRTNEPEIWLDMNGKIKSHRLLVIHY